LVKIFLDGAAGRCSFLSRPGFPYAVLQEMGLIGGRHLLSADGRLRSYERVQYKDELNRILNYG
jgi:hypothetical protein